MGYTTEFVGEFKFSKKLTPKQTEYLQKFSKTRRMRRSVDELQKLYKGKHGYPGRKKNPYGNEGEFFVGGIGYMGQEDDSSVIKHNDPPRNQPGLWCQWETDGKTLKWDGGEKFYHYTLWLHYMIKNFFEPWGVELNGRIEWTGEDGDDKGIIVVENNKIKVYEAFLEFKENIDWYYEQISNLRGVRLGHF